MCSRLPRYTGCRTSLTSAKKPSNRTLGMSRHFFAEEKLITLSTNWRRRRRTSSLPSSRRCTFASFFLLLHSQSFSRERGRDCRKLREVSERDDIERSWRDRNSLLKMHTHTHTYHMHKYRLTTLLSRKSLHS
jgi:hypothetical protein